MFGVRFRIKSEIGFHFQKLSSFIYSIALTCSHSKLIYSWPRSFLTIYYLNYLIFWANRFFKEWCQDIYIYIWLSSLLHLVTISNRSSGLISIRENISKDRINNRRKDIHKFLQFHSVIIICTQMVQFPDSRSKGTSLINVHEGGKIEHGHAFCDSQCTRKRERERESLWSCVLCARG